MKLFGFFKKKNALKKKIQNPIIFLKLFNHFMQYSKL